jgi:hypothetical protein
VATGALETRRVTRTGWVVVLTEVVVADAVIVGDTVTGLTTVVAVATFTAVLETVFALEVVFVAVFTAETDAVCTRGAYCPANTPAVAPSAAISTRLVAYAPSNFFLGFEIGLEGIVFAAFLFLLRVVCVVCLLGVVALRQNGGALKL